MRWCNALVLRPVVQVTIGDLTLILAMFSFNAGLHACHQSGASTFDAVADSVRVEQITNHAAALPAR